MLIGDKKERGRGEKYKLITSWLINNREKVILKLLIGEERERGSEGKYKLIILWLININFLHFCRNI